MFRLRLFFCVFWALLLLGCLPKTTVKVMPPIEPGHNGLLILIAKQALDGEKFEIWFNAIGKSVGTAFTPLETGPAHRQLAEKIYKEILSRKEFQGPDGILLFRNMTSYGFAACLKKDLENMSYEDFVDKTGYDRPFIYRSVILWREIMALGGKRHYTGGTG